MGYTFAAVALGLLAGIAAGGRLANVGSRPLRGVPVLAVAVVLQGLTSVVGVGGTAGLALVLASYALLTTFAVANIRLVGMPVVLVGLGLNIAVITVNGGMPVRAEALRALGEERVDELEFGAKRHLEGADDRLTFLGDVIPVRPFREVVSFGDLILAAGIANVVFRLLRPIGQRRPRLPKMPPPALIDLVEPVAADGEEQVEGADPMADARREPVGVVSAR
jgi:hypothetical protein